MKLSPFRKPVTVKHEIKIDLCTPPWHPRLSSKVVVSEESTTIRANVRTMKGEIRNDLTHLSIQNYGKAALENGLSSQHDFQRRWFMMFKSEELATTKAECQDKRRRTRLGITYWIPSWYPGLRCRRFRKRDFRGTTDNESGL